MASKPPLQRTNSQNKRLSSAGMGLLSAAVNAESAQAKAAKDMAYKEQLRQTKLQDEQEQLEKLHTMSDKEKMALHEKAQHDKKNPFKRPSMIKGQLGVYTGRGASARTLNMKKSNRNLHTKGSSLNLKKPPKSLHAKGGHKKAESTSALPSDSDDEDGNIPSVHHPDGASDYDLEIADASEKLDLRGPVYEMRSRSTKKIWKSDAHGFRKMVWKEVCLVLRDNSLEIFKTPDAAVSHHYTGLADILDIVRKDGLEGGGGFEYTLISGEKIVLRAASESEADGWVASIRHNACLDE